MRITLSMTRAVRQSLAAKTNFLLFLEKSSQCGHERGDKPFAERCPGARKGAGDAEH